MNDAERAVHLEAIVRSVDGVSSLFSPSPQVVQSLRAIAAGGSVVPLVEVTGTPEGLVIRVSVGVSSTQQAPQTAAAIARAVRNDLDGTPIADLRVRVSRIEG
jgi:hypothetical protein